MSYALAAALQTAVYNQLATDSTLLSLVGTHVYDALPAGAVPDLYVSLGTEVSQDASDMTGQGAWHRFIISVVSTAPGFAPAKAAAAAVCDALIDANLTLTRGTLVSLTFDRATALRIDADNGRRIDLRFKARLCDG